MKILGMWFSNYGSFAGRHYFNFADRGTCLILGRNLDDPRSKSNGSGKSTLVEALEWCFFGEVPRGDAADSVVNATGGKGLCVTAQVLDDEGRLVQVQRLRDYPKQKNGPRLWIDGKEVTKLDADATQADIDRAIGIDRQVWRSAVFFAQGESFNFADATDSQQKQILTKILQLDELDEWASVLEEKLRAKEQAVAGIASQLAVLVGEARYVEQQNPQANAAAWDADFQNRRAQLQQQLDFASAEVARTGQALAAVPQAQAFQNGEPPRSPEIADLDKAIAEINTVIAVGQQNIGQERGRYGDAQRAMDSIQKRGVGQCSACGQPITQEHVAHELARLGQQLAEIEERGKALKASLTDAENRRAGLLQHREHYVALQQQQLQQHAAARAVFQKQQQEAAALQQAHGNAQRMQQGLLQQWDRLAHEQNPFAAQVAAREQQLAALRGKIAEVEKEKADVERAVEHLRFWKTGFGAKGLKSYILDTRLEEMTTEVNRWVHLLTGGVVWVRFETQKQVGAGSKKKLVDTFSVRVFRHNPDGTITERNYRSWSGGEKHRIALGIDFGLARLVASRAKRSYDLLVLDEIFQKSLDSSGKEAVAELLLHLSKEKSTILVIDHDVMFQGLFEETIVVEKKHGRSRIVGATDEQGSASSLCVNDEVLASHPAFP